MAACTSGKIYKCATKKCVRELFLTFTRNRNSRYLGYYMHKLSTPVFEKRKADYRQNVLKPLEDIPTLEERLKEMNVPDPVLDAKIDIGFSSSKNAKISVSERLASRKNLSSTKLKSMKGERLEISLSQVQKDWQKSEGSLQLQNIADHYGIFKDLYDHGIFTPCVPLNISYNYDENSVNPVYMGNILQASYASTVPNVSYNSNPDDLWTLVLTNLDGHLLDTNFEYLHWFVGNIQGNELKTGETIYDYLQPFPMRGTGYHRLVFILYKQEGKIDYSSLKKPSPCTILKERTFKTFDFYKKYQDSLTPAGLAFFQCTWDETLTDFFHYVLNMQEPVFEYIEPPIYSNSQIQFPHLQPFNIYLDRYRDPKEIKKEVLLERLKNIEPFKEEKPMPKYPLVGIPKDYKFSWQKEDMDLKRLRLGKFRDLRRHSVYPQEDNQYKPDHKT